MLDQYRQDLNNDSDSLNEGRFQMSRRKVVFTLAGAALALLFFLFLIGAFRSEDEVVNEKETTSAVASELIDLQARVEKLEQMLQANPVIAANKPMSQDVNIPNMALNDNALKQLIATSSPEMSDAEPMVDAAPQPQSTPAPTPAPAPKAQARTYTVQKGDTLSKISQKCYGTTKKWKQIYDANREKISNINQLKVGTALNIPEDASK